MHDGGTSPTPVRYRRRKGYCGPGAARACSAPYPGLLEPAQACTPGQRGKAEAPAYRAEVSSPASMRRRRVDLLMGSPPAGAPGLILPEFTAPARTGVGGAAGSAVEGATL